jgi:hypothetical protein
VQKKLFPMNKCIICRHPEKVRIEAALVRNTAFRKIGEQFSVHYSSVRRHQKHMGAQLTKARHAKESADASTLLKRVEELITKCNGIAAKAEKKKAWPAAVSALSQVRACLELLGRLSGELQNAGSSLQFHAHLHQNSAAPEADADLELQIARHVSEATDGFNPREIARLKALLLQPPMLEGTFDTLSNVPAERLD